MIFRRMTLAEPYEKTAVLPYRVDRSTAQITVSDTGEALIEGNIGILEYGSDCVKLSTGKRSIRFTGEGLYIKCLNCYSAVVKGRICCIELSGGGR